MFNFVKHLKRRSKRVITLPQYIRHHFSLLSPRFLACWLLCTIYEIESRSDMDEWYRPSSPVPVVRDSVSSTLHVITRGTCVLFQISVLGRKLNGLFHGAETIPNEGARQGVAGVAACAGLCAYSTECFSNWEHASRSAPTLPPRIQAIRLRAYFFNFS